MDLKLTAPKIIQLYHI